MSPAAEHTFEYEGTRYRLVIRPTDKPRSIRGFITDEANGEEKGWMDYVVNAQLAEKWGLDDEAVGKFLSRFAAFHSRTLLAKGGAIGNDEYHFDVDFATTTPEALIQKVEAQAGNLS